MAAGVSTIYIEKYSRWSAIITLYQDIANTKPVVLTGTGLTPSMYIKASANDDTVVATPTTTIYDEANGQIKAVLTTAQTGAITTEGTTYNDVLYCVYDVILTDTSGESVRVLNGTAQISPGVTH